MPTTDELIQKMAADLRPLPRGAASRRLLAGIGMGSAIAGAAIFAWLGAPLQALPSTGAGAFTMKLLFCVALLAISFQLLLAAGRPGREIRWQWLWVLLPIALVGLSAAIELSQVRAQDRVEMWIGSTWRNCLVAIILPSVPILAGIAWAFQWLAPTRLRLSGLLAGLAAGSAAATIYALYCPEVTATFLVTWYVLGIFAVGLFGQLVGPRLLRW